MVVIRWILLFNEAKRLCFNVFFFLTDTNYHLVAQKSTVLSRHWAFYCLHTISIRKTRHSMKMKLNEWGFRPLLCTCRLNWARRTSGRTKHKIISRVIFVNWTFSRHQESSKDVKLLLPFWPLRGCMIKAIVSHSLCGDVSIPQSEWSSSKARSSSMSPGWYQRLASYPKTS